MAQVCEVVLGATEPIGGEYRDATGALVTGSSTVVLSIRRASDGHRFDFSDSTFKSTPTTATLALTETPASSGFYLYSLDTSVLAAGQNYLVSVVDTSISTVLSGLGGELRVRGINALSSAVAALPSASSITTAVWAAGARTLTTLGTGTITSATIADDAITAAKIAANAITAAKIATDAIGADQLAAGAVTEIQSGIATVAALATAQAAIEALPGSRDISAEVVADLASAHGSGAWTTANVSALATTSQLGTAQTAIIAAMPAAAPSASTIAASVVAQAIAGASAGSVGAALATASGYTVPTASQNAAAVWATDISDYGTYAQIALAGGALYGLKIGAFNKMTEAAGNPGTLTIYRDNGSTTYVTYALRDSAGSATTATSGAPAQRAAAV